MKSEATLKQLHKQMLGRWEGQTARFRDESGMLAKMNELDQMVYLKCVVESKVKY